MICATLSCYNTLHFHVTEFLLATCKNQDAQKRVTSSRDTHTLLQQTFQCPPYSQCRDFAAQAEAWPPQALGPKVGGSSHGCTYEQCYVATGGPPHPSEAGLQGAERMQTYSALHRHWHRRCGGRRGAVGRLRLVGPQVDGVGCLGGGLLHARHLLGGLGCLLRSGLRGEPAAPARHAFHPMLGLGFPPDAGRGVAHFIGQCTAEGWAPSVRAPDGERPLGFGQSQPGSQRHGAAQTGPAKEAGFCEHLQAKHGDHLPN